MHHELSCDNHLAVVADWNEHSGEAPIQNNSQTIYPLPVPVQCAFLSTSSLSQSPYYPLCVDVSSFHLFSFFDLSLPFFSFYILSLLILLDHVVHIESRQPPDCLA
jgi:hypothetical protein